MALTPTGTRSVITAQANIFCKNECGFYGNSSWHGYCSVCYRDVYLKKKKTDETERPIGLVHSSLPSFSKFEEKRKQVTSKGTNTLKNFLKKSSPQPENINKNKSVPSKLYQVADATPPLSSSSSAELKKIGEDFANFLKEQPRAVSLDLSKHIKHLIERLKTLKSNQLEEYSELIQDFYIFMTKKVQNDSVYKALSEDVRQQILDWCESYLTARIHKVVFSFRSDDEAKDIQLQKVIRSHHWITVGLLEARVDPDDQYIYDAISCLISLDSYLTPLEKLQAIVQCSSFIFKALNAFTYDSGSHAPSSADDFLPALIFVILKANPPRLQSNIGYITRFANSGRLNTGEQGYYFTNLCCAVSFIESLNFQSFSLTEATYKKFMSGELSPLTHGMTVAERVQQSLKLIAETGEAMQRLDDRCTELIQEAEEIDRDMCEFSQEFSRRVAEIRTSRPVRLSKIPTLHESS